MKKYFLAMLLTAITVVIISCEENGVEPEPQPGRRDYVWAVDTLNSPFNYFTGLWGSSPSDVWTVGAGADADSRLWHFDGTKWNVYNNEPIYCRGNALWGGSKNDIWMAGEEGEIWHYNGISWKENFLYKQDDGYASIMDIWGRNGSDIYAVGVINLSSKKEQRGFILHYNGYRWEEYFKANYISQFIYVLGDENNIFFTGIRLVFSPDNYIKVDSAYINKMTSKNFKQVYSTTVDGSTSLAKIKGEIHFVIDKGIYKYNNSGLIHIMDINEPKFAHCVYGRNYKDLFVKLYDGIGHYNGTEIAYLYKFDTDYSYYSGRPMDFSNAIFFNIPHTRNLRGFLK
jgi:hypothetical protein